MNTHSRTAGAGLLVYGVGVTAGFAASGSPGGDYEPGLVPSYIASGHWVTAFAMAYLIALAALGLVAFGQGLRGLPRVGETVWGLAVAGTACCVTGAFVVGGLEVAMAEGGRSVQSGVPHPVIYTITEIGNLLSICAPAFCVGVIALVLARRTALPPWLRAFSVVAGICGILAPLFFTYFVFVLWTITMGVSLLMARDSAARLPEPAPRGA